MAKILPNKKSLMSELRAELERELVVITQAAQAAHEAATHEESVAEDPHDTRGIESSYLAGAQSQRVVELQQTLDYYRQLEPRDFSANEPVAAGALVELSHEGNKFLYFLAPYGGGMRVSLGGRSILVITLQSPLGEELVDKKVGDLVQIEAQGATREYEIESIG